MSSLIVTPWLSPDLTGSLFNNPHPRSSCCIRTHADTQPSRMWTAVSQQTENSDQKTRLPIATSGPSPPALPHQATDTFMGNQRSLEGLPLQDFGTTLRYRWDGVASLLPGNSVMLPLPGHLRPLISRGHSYPVPPVAASGTGCPGWPAWLIS